MKVGLLTVSDRAAAGQREDRTGPGLLDFVEGQGWSVVRQAVVPDDAKEIAAALRQWADESTVELLLTAGGTGFGPRDVTPEATLEVCERLAPGLAEVMRRASLEVTPHAMLSRAVAGIRRKTLIVNLPGSPKGARENLEAVLPALPHAIRLLREDGAQELDHSPPRHTPTT